jgi:antitoxin component HigA of HigAB toxin-antitoxin module
LTAFLNENRNRYVLLWTALNRPEYLCPGAFWTIFARLMEHLTDCRSFNDLRQAFNSVDRVVTKKTNGVCVFNLGHGKSAYRLIAGVMDWIAVRAHNQDQFDYAKMLGSLVTEYEVSQKRRTKLQFAGLELLKAVTDSSGMTQAELARVLAVEQGTVSKIMSGARSITLDHAKRLARRFKMRPEAFLDLD